MNVSIRLVLLLSATLVACNLIPKDTTAERETMIREHERAVAEKQEREQAAGISREEQALLVQDQQRSKAQADESAALSERVHEEAKAERELATWKRGWSVECATALNYSTCSQGPKLSLSDDKTKCYSACEPAIDEALRKLLQGALADCVSADGEATCRIEFPSSAAQRDGTPFSKDAITDAKGACSAECEKGRKAMAVAAVERPKAAAAGESLVLAYKRCMLAVDSTHQAVTYRIHDTELYQDLMAKADARCRLANRCSWLEEFSDDWRCAYGN